MSAVSMGLHLPFSASRNAAAFENNLVDEGRAEKLQKLSP